jgi:RNA polymerase sigma-70 factor (ECF subfamily)
MPERPQSTALDPIFSRRAEFRAFLISRLGSEADADDVLQNGLIKALRNASDVRDEQKLTAWFYQVLRNAIVDHVRNRRARELRDDAWVSSASAPHDHETAKIACRCVDILIAELKPAEAELVRRVELENEPVTDAARRAGVSPNHASVTLHRARKKLRERLLAFCGECATGACLDCDCAPRSDGNSSNKAPDGAPGIGALTSRKRTDSTTGVVIAPD